MLMQVVQPPKIMVTAIRLDRQSLCYKLLHLISAIKGSDITDVLIHCVIGK